MVYGQRVVVTGMGIVSCLGNTLDEVAQALRDGRSGIRYAPEFAERGFDSHVVATPTIDLDAQIERKKKRFMGTNAAFAYIALRDALRDAELPLADQHADTTGLIVGTGAGSITDHVDGIETLQAKGFRRVSPYLVPRWMGSTASANLSTAFGIHGISYTTTSACASSAHAIGAAYEQIRSGAHNIMLTGGSEEYHWSVTNMFDAMGALSTHYNATPTRASKPFDAHRDGFVVASGAGMLVLESLDHALARGAKIYAELIAFGASSDGHNMVVPSGEGAVRCMRMALRQCLQRPDFSSIDYINAHATGTPAGDMVELAAIAEVFAERQPLISSTKALTGHSMGAVAAQEAIYSLLMLRDQFVAASHNIEHLDERAVDANLARQTLLLQPLQAVMSNSFGFGGTNASLVFAKLR